MANTPSEIHNPPLQNKVSMTKGAFSDYTSLQLMDKMLEKLKLEYAGVVGEKCALQAELDFLNQDLAAAREENGGRISSQVSELKKHNEDLVQELKTLRVKRSLEVVCCAFATVLGFFILIGVFMRLALSKRF